MTRGDRTSVDGDGDGGGAQGPVSRRRMLGGVAAVGAGALVVQSATVHDAMAVQDSMSAFGINVLDYIPNPADATTHTAGFQAAIAAAVSGDGDEIVIPAGKWYVEGLSIPQRASLKFRGAGATAFPYTSGEFEGLTTGTQLIRTGDAPIFSVIGPESAATGDTYENTLKVFFNYIRDFLIEDVALVNVNANAITPLVDMKGCSGGNFSRVTWYSPEGSSLLDMQSVFDTRFVNCFFAGGGKSSTGLGAVRIVGQEFTGNTSRPPSKELQFVNCHFESYYGTGIQIGDAASSALKPQLLLFSNIKMESLYCSGPHVAVSANSVFVSNFYITHHITSGPVLDLQRVNGFYGSVAFNQGFATGWVDPSCRLNVSADASLINLDVNLLSGPASTVNVVTIANPADPLNNITISGASQRVNGTNALTRYHRDGIVYQRVTEDTVNCAYVFAKGDLMAWSLGNPANPSGSVQEFSISGMDASGNVGTFLTLRADGPDPATSARAAVFGAAVLLESAGTNAYIVFPGQLETPASDAGIQLYAKDDGSGHLKLVLRNQAGTPSAVITRNLATYTATETLGAAPQTDYIALLGSGAVVSLPTAEANRNKYTLKNITTEDMVVATTASQTIEGTVGITLSAGASINVVSDGSGWRII